MNKLDKTNKELYSKNAEYSAAKSAIKIGIFQLNKEKEMPTYRQRMYLSHLKHLAEENEIDIHEIVNSTCYSRESFTRSISEIKKVLVANNVVEDDNDEHWLEAKNGKRFYIKDASNCHRCGICKHYILDSDAKEGTYMTCSCEESSLCGLQVALDMYCKCWEDFEL